MECRWGNCMGCQKEVIVECLKNSKERIATLDVRIEHLRVSRRVLMNLLEKVEKEKNYLEFRLSNRERRKKDSGFKYPYKLITNKHFCESELNSEGYVYFEEDDAF